MVGVNFSSSRILSSAVLATCLALGAVETSAQTYYWNPSMIKTLEAQRSFNWSENNSLTGARNYPPSDKDDQFSGTALDTNWKFVDYDGPEYTATQSLAANSGKLTITAQGDDVWTNINEFAGVYRTDIKGNFDVSVRIDSHTKPHIWSKAGFMIWNDFTNVSGPTNQFSSGGGFVVQVSGGSGFAAHADLASPQGYVDGPEGGNDPTLVKYPCWLRVTRVGTEFRGYYRTDTTATWTLIGNSSYSPLGAVAGGSSHIGLFTMSHLTGTTATTVFDDFRGGGNLISNNLDLRFAGTPVLDNATLAGNLSAKSVDFTGYTGAFSFGASTLSVSGNLTFSSGMAINPNTGRLVLSGTSGTQNLVPKANDTLPSIWKTGAGEAVVQGTNPLLADSLHVESGVFNLNSNNAHLQQFTASGGTLQGFTATDDTLFIYQRAAFGGLQNFTAGSGTVAIKSVGAGKTVSFDPGGKSFRNVNLWAVPTGGSGAAVQVGPGALAATGDLTFRQQRAPAGQNAEVSFQSGNPNVTVAGNVSQVLEGASGANAFPIRMGDGNWSVGGSLAFSLANGSAGVSTLDLTRASGPQTLNVTGGSLNAVRHTGNGTVFLASPLSANSLSLTAGVFSLANNNLTLSGNLEVDGAPGLLDSLGGRTVTVGGNASFKGRAGNLLRLNPSTPWFIKVNGAGNLTAEYASLGNSDASSGAIGEADSNSVNQGGNINWSFGGGAPTTVPKVTSEPKDTTVIEGANASFSVNASGTAPLSYAWRRNSDTATIGTGSSLSVNGVTLAMNGWTYLCIVTNSAGKDTTIAARLTVNKAPVPAKVAVEPVDKLAHAGGGATFSFTAEGDAPLAYAWYRKGEDAPIANTPGLALTGLVLGQNDTYYYCIVSNAVGADTTREALLNVIPQPIPVQITVEPRDTSIFVTEKAVFRVAASGSDPIAFQWRRKGDTTVISTDTVLTISSAAQAQDGSIFICIVSNAHGRDTTREAKLTVKPPPMAPTIIREPSDTLVKVGARVAFSVGVLGSAPLAFEWHRTGDTAVLSGDSLYVLNAVTDAHSGTSYFVIVSNSTGISDTSAEAHLTVRICDSLSIQVSPGVTANEGQNVSIFGKAVCADRFEWTVASGPAPRLLDPGVDTLAFKAPRVSGDTVIRYLFSAWFGETVQNKEVAVKVRESIPDPSMALTAAQVTWSGSKPLAVKPTVFNKDQLDLFTGYPLRYVWALAPALADSASAGDSLTLKDPSGDGRMDVVLCMDNGGKAACDTVRVDIDRNQVALLPRGARLMEGLTISGSWLTWSRPGVVRIWTWNGRLLFESRGLAGTTALIPPAALGALRGRTARLVFTP